MGMGGEDTSLGTGLVDCLYMKAVGGCAMTCMAMGGETLSYPDGNPMCFEGCPTSTIVSMCTMCDTFSGQDICVAEDWSDTMKATDIPGMMLEGYGMTTYPHVGSVMEARAEGCTTGAPCTTEAPAE